MCSEQAGLEGAEIWHQALMPCSAQPLAAELLSTHGEGFCAPGLEELLSVQRQGSLHLQETLSVLLCAVVGI